MSQWTRILLPVGLGLAALMLNAWTVSRAIAPGTFTVLARDVEPGEIIERDMLMPIEIGGDVERLRQVMYPWSEAANLQRAHFRRPLKQGDPVLFVDVNAGRTKDNAHLVNMTVRVQRGTFVPELIDPGDEVTFVFEAQDDLPARPLGPFAVVAIGARTTVYSPDLGTERSQSLTVAIDRASPQKEQLIAALERSSVQSVEVHQGRL